MIDNAASLNAASATDSKICTMVGRVKNYEAILARNRIGRIAFAVEDRVSVLPVEYAFTGGWIYGQTTLTDQLRRLLRNRRVAFEVDEHNPLLEWQSVVVRGPLSLIDTPAGRDRDQEQREQLFRMRVIEISGRTSGPRRGRNRSAFPEAD